MLLLLALLAAADPAADSAPSAHGAEASVLAGAGSRGEERAEISARVATPGVSLVLGAVESEGAQAPRRQELFCAADLGVVRGELRAVPLSAGLTRFAGELGVHSESLGLTLGGKLASLGQTQMQGLGARVEVEGDLWDGVRAGTSAAAWALQLQTQHARDPWTAFGMSTLDWPQRFEGGAWIAAEAGALSLAPEVSVAQPPQAGAFEAHGGLTAELQLGAARLRAEAGLARLWPDALWLFDLTLGVTMTLY